MAATNDILDIIVNEYFDELFKAFEKDVLNMNDTNLKNLLSITNTSCLKDIVKCDFRLPFSSFEKYNFETFRKTFYDILRSKLNDIEEYRQSMKKRLNELKSEAYTLKKEYDLKQKEMYEQVLNPIYHEINKKNASQNELMIMLEHINKAENTY